MKFLNYLFIFLIAFVVTINCKDYEDGSEELLNDFDFGGGTNTNDELENNEDNEEYEIGTDYEIKEEQKEKTQISAKEAMVRQIILNSMKTSEMKDKVAKVLPILRVMSPDQKLALATLVTTQVLAPPQSKGLSLEEVRTLFGNNPNTTAELMLPISLDVANMFRTARSEKGPTAEELRAPYKRPPGLYRRNIIERGHKYYRPRKPVIKASNRDSQEPNCDLFTSNICLKSHDYPIDAIMSSIRRNKHAMNALLADMKSMPADGNASSDGIAPEIDDGGKSVENNDDSNEIRRTGGESGYMCPSQVRYARPQKARATSGLWKYIVNTPEHTQTLRLERCMKAGDTCTYLTDNFKSRCVQVYNYHRLLTWDQTNGLHMDIFKVPTCCSCHIDSYKVPFPPHHANHATTSENFPGEDIIDHEPSATTPIQSDTFLNSISNSGHYINDPSQYTPNHHIDFPSETSFKHESTKLRPSIENRPALPKYLEAPKPQAPITKHNYNPTFKRSTPKPFTNPKRPNRPLRRRQPSKPVRDLAQSESNVGQFSTDAPTTTTTVSPTKVTRKINYNYHPIIDFFKPDQIESRMDLNFGDSEWRPVTSMLLSTVTERGQFRKK